MKINVLKDAQDITVIENLGDGNYVYAAKPSLDIMKQFYEQSIENPEDRNVNAFDDYWEFYEKTGIKGSSTFLTLRLDKLALRPNDLWVPGLLEAKVIGDKGKLESEVFRDYGIVVHDSGEPNKHISEVLVPQARKLGLKLPLIVPFRSLDYVNDQNKTYGIKLFLLNSGIGIIQGEEAQNKINSFDYEGNSGVQRFPRYWDDLSGSNHHDKVDWICGEATQEILEKAYSKLSERKYGERIRELKEEQKSEHVKFIESLKR